MDVCNLLDKLLLASIPDPAIACLFHFPYCPGFFFVFKKFLATLDSSSFAQASQSK